MEPDLKAPKLPLISIITVCFNAERFIKQTIESVLSQTYSHVEYIIIDGGSTDSTVNIIRNYESRLAFWMSQPDRGVSHAFNLGFAAATGQWFLYLNADDFFLGPTVIEQMVPYLIQHSEKDIVFGGVMLVTRDEEPQSLPLPKIYGSPWRWGIFRLVNTIPHQASFINRRYFERVGEFDENFRIAMDYELFLRRGKKLQARQIPIVLVGMRVGGLCSPVIHSLNEGRLAQQKTKALPHGLAWINFFLQIGRFYLSRIGHKILDRFACRISWADKCTERIVNKI
jgi:glycosyltransferase involved in cell wall biosynthesis